MINTTSLDKSLLKGFKYSPQTGLIFRNKIKNNAKAGPALTQDRGYRIITINGKKHLQHRLVFLFMDTDTPEGMYVDHINGCRSDNTWKNLRLVTSHQNCLNRIEHRNGGTPYVLRIKQYNKWSVSKTVNTKTIHFGSFKTEEEAIREKERLEKLGWPPRCYKPKNIHFSPEKGKWIITKKTSGKTKQFGRFKTEEDAIKRRDELVENNWKI
jgi:hypothetical protein